MKHEHKPMRPIERLSRLREYRVDKHDIDPRGWKVVNAEGRAIGEVTDLIVDTSRMIGTYLDVELDAKFFELRDDPHILIPMSRAQREGGQRRLVVSGLTRDRVAELYAARDEHTASFWDRWWGGESTAAGSGEWSPRIGRAGASEMRIPLGDVKPGEEMRIPIVNEELVIERRPVHPDEKAVARSREDTPPEQPVNRPVSTEVTHE